MEVVLLVVHLFITLAMTGVILLQRSEGGGLGMGGSSTPGGGLFSARGGGSRARWRDRRPSRGRSSGCDKCRSRRRRRA